MGTGEIQLVSYGEEDKYIMGNPQITFFKSVYRKHTNFSIESIKQDFTGSLSNGQKAVCTINRSGDLLSKMHLYAEGKGKAFSYFGTIAKRYLILSNQKNYKKRIDTVSINDLEANNTFDDESYRYQKNPLNSFQETTNGVGEYDLKEYPNHKEGEVVTNNDKLSYFMDDYIEYCTENIYKIFGISLETEYLSDIITCFK